MYNNKSILIVDDQLQNIQLMIDALERLLVDFTIFRANNVELALQIAHKKMPDIIITDWDMPKLSGIELIRELKRSTKTADIPIIMCTGIMLTSEHLRTAMRAGAFDYLRKPIDPVEIESRVFSALRFSETLQQLKNERTQFLSLLNNIPEQIYVSELETSKVLFANKAKRNVYGDDIIGKPCYQAFNKGTDRCDSCSVEELTNSENQSIKSEVYDNDTDRHFSNFDNIITWQDGQKAKFQISFDLTEQRKTEQMNKKLSVAIEQNPATIVITDTKGRIEYANPQFTKLTGYSLQEAAGKNPRILKSGKTPKQAYPELWKTITSGKIWKGEFSNRKKNGEIFVEKATIAPIFDDTGEIINYLAVKEDITYRKKMEDALKASQQQLNDILNAFPGEIYLNAPDYTIEYMNLALENRIGKDKIGEKCYQAIYGFNEKCNWCNNHLLNKNNRQNVRERYLPETDQFFDVSKSLMHNGSVLTLYMETTQIRHAERKYSLLFENMLEAFALHEMVFDENGTPVDYKFLDVNPYFEKLTGLKREEVIGNNVMEILPETEQYWIDTYAKVVESGEAISYQNYSKALDRYYNCYAFRPSAKTFAVVFSDVTDEMKLAAEVEAERKKLEASEEKYRLIAQNAQDVIWILNLSKKAFTYISPSVFNLRGFTPDEAIKQDVNESLTPESAALVTQMIQKRVPEFLADPQRGAVYIDQLQQPCKDGSIIWIETSTKYSLNSKGEIEVLGISRNIENRKRMEAEILEQNKQLTELNATKDKFFSIVSHDLKNPFNLITGFSELILSNSDKFDNDKVLEFVSAINNSSKSAYKLLINLLEWARTQTGQIQFNPQPIALKDFIVDAVHFHDEIAQKKGISIGYELADNLAVKADENMLNTIIRNFISNALKYTPKGGRINVSAQKKEDQIKISISDTGVGMTAETISKLFKINEKVSSRGTENEQGTGLGLLLCNEFVAMHEGKIEVESQLGQGSVFSFTLPASVDIEATTGNNESFLTMDLIKLSNADKEYLRPFVTEVQKIPETDKQMRIKTINTIDFSRSQSVMFFRQELLKAIHTSNYELFKSLKAMLTP